MTAASKGNNLIAWGLAVVLSAGTFFAMSQAGSAAHVRKVGSSVSIDYRNERFVGDVASNRRKCMKDRLVRLLKVQNDGDRVVVGADRTGFFGNYKIKKPNADGRYQARIRRKFFPGYSHTLRCGGDRSPFIRVNS